MKFSIYRVVRNDCAHPQNRGFHFEEFEEFLDTFGSINRMVRELGLRGRNAGINVSILA